MRIVHLTVDWHPTGGVSSYIRLVAPAQAAAGHQVLVVHAGEPGGDDARLAAEGVTVRAFPGAVRATGADEARHVPAVLDAVGAFAPDLAHFHASNNFSIEEAVRARVPALKTLHALAFCPTGTKYHAATGHACTFRTGLMCVPRQAYLRCASSRRPTVWWRNYTQTVRANAHHQSFEQLVVTSEYVRRQAMANGFDGDRIAVVPYFTTVPAEVPPAAGRDVLYIGRIAWRRTYSDVTTSCSNDWWCAFARTVCV